MNEGLTENAGMNVGRVADYTLIIGLTGNWQIGFANPPVSDVLQQIEKEPAIRQIMFESKALIGWDSSILTFLLQVIKLASMKGVRIEQDGLPHGVQKLLTLATAVPKKEDARKKKPPPVYQSI